MFFPRFVANKSVTCGDRPNTLCSSLLFPPLRTEQQGRTARSAGSRRDVRGNSFPCKRREGQNTPLRMWVAGPPQDSRAISAGAGRARTTQPGFFRFPPGLETCFLHLLSLSGSALGSCLACLLFLPSSFPSSFLPFFIFLIQVHYR